MNVKQRLNNNQKKKLITWYSLRYCSSVDVLLIKKIRQSSVDHKPTERQHSYLSREWVIVVKMRKKLWNSVCVIVQC